MDVATIALPIATLALGIAVVRSSRKTDQVLSQLAELKALLAEARAAAGPTTATATVTATTEARETLSPRPSPDIAAEELQPTQLFFCTHDGKMVLGIKKLELQRLARVTRTPIRGAQARLGALKPILQASRSVLTHAGIAEGQLMEVVLNGPAAATRGNEALTAMVRGARGKVVEPSRVRELPPLGALPASAVASAATALAQHPYLESIDSMLAELSKGLTEVRDLQGAELKVTLAKAVTFLRDVVLAAVRRGSLSPALVAELDATEARLVKQQEELVHLHRMLNRHTKHILCAGEFDPDEMFKAVADHIKAVDATRKQFVWTVQARLAGLQFQALFSQESPALQQRRDAIAQSAVTPELGAKFEGLVQSIGEKLDGLDDALSDDKTLGHRKASMKVFAQHAFENTRAQLLEVLKALEESAAHGTLTHKPIRLAVRVDKGRFEAFELVPRQPEAPAPAPKPSASAALA
jgi:hypothetical protein